MRTLELTLPRTLRPVNPRSAPRRPDSMPPSSRRLLAELPDTAIERQGPSAGSPALLERPRKTCLLDAVEIEEISGSGAHLTIEYCVPGNFGERARRLAGALHDETGCRVTLIPSRDGAFEVSVNGRRVFSKRASWRLPDTDEILYHVANA